jgi:hypothetical protein
LKLFLILDPNHSICSRMHAKQCCYTLL